MLRKIWVILTSCFIISCFTDSKDSDKDSDNGSIDTNSGNANTDDTDMVSDTGDEQCGGQPDFTKCSLVTTQDSAYDICVNGYCQSPGCGTAVCNAPYPHFTLPDTNQRICYNLSRSITCADSGKSLSGQDAQYGWDVNHLETERFTRNLDSAEEPLVTDNVTNLVWQGCFAGLSGNDCAIGTLKVYAWSEAFTYCNTLQWGGLDNWRLPDQWEIDSILDSNQQNPSIDITAFPATPSFGGVWSSSSYAEPESSGAWYVDFASGYTGRDSKKGEYHVRCVQGGTPIRVVKNQRFIFDISESTEPVVSDTVTDMMWQGCAAGLSDESCNIGTAKEITWDKALDYCESLSWGGHSDWRLPNRIELFSILDTNKYEPSPLIDVTAFPATPSSNFWSSTSRVGIVDRNITDQAWVVDFKNGEVVYHNKSYENHVRCVRGGS